MRRDQLYGRAWRKARRVVLAENPCCVMCNDEGKITPAMDVDHIQPHKGDPVLFWDVNNWQGLCKHHHQSTKARMERGQQREGCNLNGIPFSRITGEGGC